MSCHECQNCGGPCYCDLDDSNDARRSEDDCTNECQQYIEDDQDYGEEDGVW